MSDLNRAWWDERLPIHLASELYDLESFRLGRDPIRPFEDEELGPVEGRTLAHLQCHFGLDSLGWARRGARVSGLDFSQPAVDTANGLADELGLDAEFVCADVYDAFGALANGASTSSTPGWERSTGCPTSSAGRGRWRG